MFKSVIFRVDSSCWMGTGHVMRCLSLAEGLKNRGADVSFICREFPGNLIDLIEKKGFLVFRLGGKQNIRPGVLLSKENNLLHASWLGVTQDEDAEDCKKILNKFEVNWLIIDHYAIDRKWEDQMSPFCKHLMVIDDLGDREHSSKVLLDQNYGASDNKYKNLVPHGSVLLIGSYYSLMRPEFLKWREYSLERRRRNKFELKKLLINLGGGDPSNTTESILKVLKKSGLPSYLDILIVLGASAPNVKKVTGFARTMPVSTEVRVNVGNMAEILSNVDLVIGAAGSSTWERCCLGVPSIQLVIAENQRLIADEMHKVNAVKLINSLNDLPLLIENADNWMQQVSEVSSKLVDGKGVDRVAKKMSEIES